METDFTSEKEALLNRKDSDITELKQQLDTLREDLSKQEIQTQAHKQVLDKTTMEKEAVQVSRKQSKFLSHKILKVLTLSQTSPGFYVSAVQVF